VSHRDLEQLATAGAREIHASFGDYFARFVELSRKARQRFEQQDWHAHQSDSIERLGLHSQAVHGTMARLEELFGELYPRHELWCRLKPAYAELARGERNYELARTFFNSVTRRTFGTVGVDPEIEFPATEFDEPPDDTDPRIFARYEPRGETHEVIARILEDQRLDTPYSDAAGDAILAAEQIDDLLIQTAGSPIVESFEMLRSVFFRNKAAYIVGRIRSDSGTIPLILPLVHSQGGVSVDAVLTNHSDVSVLFSFTRSYFQVDADCPRAVIAFLRSILPEKPTAELYIAIGLYKHGKTELYRSLQRHLDRSSDLFEIASGDEGMVMHVFTLPSYDRVFKLIRDEFAYPKETTVREIRERYRLVFERDRVGRLVEAQQFEHLKFRKDRLAPSLLRELREKTARMVREDGDWLVIEHMYIERRVRPLNLYLREASRRDARLAIIDYGAAIKELAAANIFPGDFLLKNFGVTRHGRVAFYDYDELCLLTDCRFRELPEARHPEDELSAEPWFTVADNDVFPEEFRRFLGMTDELLTVFERHHGELFTAQFWRDMQERHRAGEVLDFYPYPRNRRLRS
jgi:isocitrate dehydrogenase kinase/phosphatase